MKLWPLPWPRRDPAPPAPPGDPARDATALETLQELAKNLVTLEINTIVKENMVAGPMPTIPNALIEIAHSYIRVFERCRLDVTDVYRCEVTDAKEVWEAAPVTWYPPGTQAPGFFRVPEENIRFYHLFLFLRWAARTALRLHAERFANEDVVMLRRIEDNSDKLRAVLQSKLGKGQLGAESVTLSDLRTRFDVFSPPPELTLYERLMIKKIWEVGSERVIAQTVIQIDGDVVTRIASDFHKQIDIDRLLSLHQRGLETAIGRWEALVRGAAAVIQGLTGSLLK